MTVELVFEHYPLKSNVLPATWAMVRIADIAKSVSSGFPCGKHNNKQIGVPHVRPMNIDREGRLDLSDTKYVDVELPRLLRRGDVLFNNTNSPELIGKTTAILVDVRLAYSNHMTRIVLETGINPTFAARQLHYLWMTGYFRHRCKNHVNQASISTDPLSETVPFLLPPVHEQNRIAEALDELLSDLDAGLATLERAQAKLKHYRAVLLKAAIDGDLTAEWREQHTDIEPASVLIDRVLDARRRNWEEARLDKFKEAGKSPPKNWKAKYKEPNAPNIKDLAKLPVGWCWVSLDQLVEDGLIGLDRGQQYQRTTPSGSAYIKMNNVTMEGQVLSDDLVYVETSNEEQSRYELRAGDLLFNTRNSKELVGKIGIVKQVPAKSVYNNNLMRLRFDGAALPAFICYQMCAPGFRSRMEPIKKATTSVAAVYAKDLFPLQIALPPLAEQVAIVEALEDQLTIVEHLESDLEAKLKNIHVLRQSMLRHAFSGWLVTQDPTDEPATALLKRIAAEREERSRQTKPEKRTRTESKTRSKFAVNSR